MGKSEARFFALKGEKKKTEIIFPATSFVHSYAAAAALTLVQK